MLPGLSFEHIIILGVIALVVVGPKDLPLLLRKMGQWTARLRGMAQEFRTGFDELARQAELDELKKEVEALRRTTSLTNISSEISKPLGTLESYAGLSPPPPPPLPPPQLEKSEAALAAVAPLAAASSEAAPPHDAHDGPDAPAAPAAPNADTQAPRTAAAP